MEFPHPRARLIEAASRESVGGAELLDRAGASARDYANLPSGVVFVAVPMRIEAVVRYLGAWGAERVVLPLDVGVDPASLHELVHRYEPAAVIGWEGEPPSGYNRRVTRALGAFWSRGRESSAVPHSDLGLLLTTSGSTGSPKLVRLSRAAVVANTMAIIDVLDIGSEEVTISSLPFHYSFGLSVLQTYVVAGATVILESGGMVQRSFWDAVSRFGVMSIAAVPYQFEVMRRLRFDPARHPRLRTLTQAGGRLAPDRVTEFHERMVSAGGQLFVMYGQTEAGPRMTTLPPERLLEKLGSVGPALPGGRLSIRDDEGREATGETAIGEVLYRGPNVMMGYAEKGTDLGRGDQHHGLLETGDLGRLDSDGYLYLEGRRTRFGKVFGIRVSLDDVEAMVAGAGPVAAVSGDDRIIVWIEGGNEEELHDRAVALAQRLHVHWTGVVIRAIDHLPLLPSGKVDRLQLERLS